MKKIAVASLVVLLSLAAVTSAGIEVLGIEVLGIEVLGIEVPTGDTMVHVRTDMAPLATYAEGTVQFGDITVPVSAAPICPLTGCATVHFPAGTFGPEAGIRLRGPMGELLSSSDYAEIIELD